MHKLKSIFTWVLFALCLVAAFGFGYFVRGTVSGDVQTSGTEQTTSSVVITYILNTSSKKIHYPTCSSAKKIADKNRGSHTGDYTGLLAKGYTTCGICFKN